MIDHGFEISVQAPQQWFPHTLEAADNLCLGFFLLSSYLGRVAGNEGTEEKMELLDLGLHNTRTTIRIRSFILCWLDENLARSQLESIAEFCCETQGACEKRFMSLP